MTSPQFLCSCIFITSLLLLISIPPSQSSPQIGQVGEVQSDPSVNLTLYYESLCPGCGDMIVYDFNDLLYNKSLSSIIDLRMVPWGNARLGKPNVQDFVCQHGSDECYFNTIDACAIEVYNGHSYALDQYVFDFISCREVLAFQRQKTPSLDKEQVWRYCCEQVQFDPIGIENCYNSSLGKKVELRYAYETAHLRPPHTYVPWILVNGQHIEDVENLLFHICKAYTGNPVPPACKSVHSKKKSAKGNSKIRTCAASGATIHPVSEPASPHGSWMNRKNKQP